MTRRVAAAAAAVACAIALAGCGGGGSGSTSTIDAESFVATGPTVHRSLLRSDYILRADLTCAELQKRLESDRAELLAEQAPSGKPSDEVLARLTDEVVVPVLEEQTERLLGFLPPERDEDTVATILAAGETALADVQDDPTLLRKANGAEAFAEADRLAEEYGFLDCLAH